MALNSSLLILLGILTGIECRSIISSSRSEATRARGNGLPPGVANFIDDYAGNVTTADGDFLGAEEFQRSLRTQSPYLERIWADFAARIGDFEDREDRAVQWLRLLKRMLRSLPIDETLEKSRPRSDAGVSNGVDEKKNPAAEYNWLENLFEFLDQQDIDGQTGGDYNQRHVQSRYDNSSSATTLETDGISTTNTKNVDTSGGVGDLEELNTTLVAVGNDIERIRLYINKFCSEHHAMLHAEARSGDRTLRNSRTKEVLEKKRGSLQEE